MESELSRSRAGFTLVEVIVALAIMVMIAATVTPSVVRSIDRKRQDEANEMFDLLGDAIGRFRTDVGVYPRTLGYLSQAITSTDLNSCGSAFGLTRAGLWKGPYVSRIVTSTGLPVFIGTAQNTLIRTPTTGGTAPTLTIRVDNVRLDDAEALDLRYDAPIGATTGSVRWTVLPSGLVTFDFVQSISSC